MDDCDYRHNTNTIQSLGYLLGIMPLPDLVVFGYICNIQNNSFRNSWLFAVAIPRNRKHNRKKIFMAIDNRRNSSGIIRSDYYDIDVKHLAHVKKFYYHASYNGKRNCNLFCECSNKL